VWRVRANRSSGNRAYGGWLVLTRDSVAFLPHRFERSLGGAGAAWECDLSGVTSVSVAPRGWNVLNGSLRRRVLIATKDGSEYFVCPEADLTVDRITEAVAAE
jgi:hypothetical protein